MDVIRKTVNLLNIGIRYTPRFYAKLPNYKILSLVFLQSQP